ncbi:MAG: sigma-70 family RNA polymerase sigma factor [Kineosporiaceae bacterium]
MTATADRPTAGPYATFEAFAHDALPRLTRFARWVAADDADDLVQTALERTGARWAAVGREDPEAYVRRAIVNGHVSRWRTRRRERLVATVPGPRLVTGDGFDQSTLRHSPVWQAIHELPPGQRAVVALRFVDDLSVSETARLLGLSEGTVKTQSHRALTALRHRLAGEPEDVATDVRRAAASQATPITGPGAVASLAVGARRRRRRRTVLAATVTSVVVAGAAITGGLLAWRPWSDSGQVQPVAPPAPTTPTSTAPSLATPSGSATVGATDPAPPTTPSAGPTAATVVVEDVTAEVAADGMVNFETPTGNIQCAVYDFGSFAPLGADCQVFEAEWAVPQVGECELDWVPTGVSLGEEATAGWCAGDTFLVADPRRQAYDTGLRAGPIECVVRTSGVTCRNVDTGRGFVVSRSSYELF